MSELRQNMATKEWVIIANERAKRPDDYIEESQTHIITELGEVHDSNCPFCVGNEELDLEVERISEPTLQGKRIWRTVRAAPRHIRMAVN